VKTVYAFQLRHFLSAHTLPFLQNILDQKLKNQ
jgi:hypothetical protein